VGEEGFSRGPLHLFHVQKVDTEELTSRTSPPSSLANIIGAGRALTADQHQTVMQPKLPKLGIGNTLEAERPTSLPAIPALLADRKNS
jgi:hypothetical protein